MRDNRWEFQETRLCFIHDLVRAVKDDYKADTKVDTKNDAKEERNTM